MSRVTRLTVSYICVVFSVTAVSCQVPVRGFIGDSVLLPCVYTDVSPRPETVSVYWRDKDDNHVVNIKQNKEDFSSQSRNFRGRVQSFPDLYKTGNFSIILKNLQQSDSGPYECLIPDAENFQQDVSLTVSGKRVEVAATSRPPPSGHNAAGRLNSLLLTLLCVPLSLFSLCSLN